MKRWRASLFAPLRWLAHLDLRKVAIGLLVVWAVGLTISAASWNAGRPSCLARCCS